MFKYSWHIWFGVAFLIVFAGVLLWSYRTDIRKQKIYYKGTWKVVAGVLGAGVATYLLVKFMVYSLSETL